MGKPLPTNRNPERQRGHGVLEWGHSPRAAWPRSAATSGSAGCDPFEGDQRLAVILSKAMMLAEDTKIKDPTILSQIGR